MSPCQPIAPLGRPSQGGLTGSPDAGRCSAKAASSSPSRRRRRRRFPAPGCPPRPARPLGRGTGRHCPHHRQARAGGADAGRSRFRRTGQAKVLLVACTCRKRPEVRYPSLCRPAERHKAGCPSGQRERSVKPSASPSMVRIHHLPPGKTPAQGCFGVPDSFRPMQPDATGSGRMPLVVGYTWDSFRSVCPGREACTGL